MGIWDKFWTWLSDEPPQQNSDQTGATAVATQTLTEVEGEAAADTQDQLPWWQPEGEIFTQLIGIQPPELSPEAVAIENLLVSYFDGHDLNMPPLSHVTERVLQQLRNRKSSMGKVAETLSEDPVLAASVLRMANCPLYRGLHKITAVTPAATRLGAKAIHTLMMHESLRSAMFPGKQGETSMAQRLWSRSLVAAHVMRALSKFTNVDEEDAYLLGLLHDIGCVVVLRIILNDRTVSSFDPDERTFEYLCAECHQEFGELIANEWNLPDDIKAIITDHHRFPSEDDPLRTHRLQLQLTDIILSLQRFQPYQPYDLLNTDVVKALNLHMRPNFVPFLENIPNLIDEAFSSF